jgi:hypothetical protein
MKLVRIPALLSATLLGQMLGFKTVGMLIGKNNWGISLVNEVNCPFYSLNF